MDNNFSVRIPPRLLEEYHKDCKERGVTASADIRQHIADMLKERVDKLLSGSVVA